MDGSRRGARVLRAMLFLACAALPYVGGAAAALRPSYRTERHEPRTIMPSLTRRLELGRERLPVLATAIANRFSYSEKKRERDSRSTTLRRGERPFRLQRSAPCARLLLYANVATYAAQVLTLGWLTAAGCKPAGAFRGRDWPRLFTPMFLHGACSRQTAPLSCARTRPFAPAR